MPRYPRNCAPTATRNYPTPGPAALRPPRHRRAVEVRGTTTAMWRLTRSSIGAAAGLLVAIALCVGAIVSDVDIATRCVLRRCRRHLIMCWRGQLLADDSGLALRSHAAVAIPRGPYVRVEDVGGPATPDARPTPIPTRTRRNPTSRRSAARRSRGDRLRPACSPHVWFVGDLDHAGRGVVRRPAAGR